MTDPMKSAEEILKKLPSYPGKVEFIFKPHHFIYHSDTVLEILKKGIEKKSVIDTCDELQQFVGQALEHHILAERKRAEELATVLSAWHSAFGTTQLTHASDRLSRAEEDNKKKDREIERLKAENERLRDFSKSYDITENGVYQEAKKEIDRLNRQVNEGNDTVARLSASLAKAHEVLGEIVSISEKADVYDMASNAEMEMFDKAKQAISDPTGQKAYERWKKMEAVVEQANRWWKSKRPVSWSVKTHLENPTVNCGFYSKDLALAVSNLDALNEEGKV